LEERVVKGVSLSGRFNERNNNLLLFVPNWGQMGIECKTTNFVTKCAIIILLYMKSSPILEYLFYTSNDVIHAITADNAKERYPLLIHSAIDSIDRKHKIIALYGQYSSESTTSNKDGVIVLFQGNKSILWCYTTVHIASDMVCIINYYII
jgi:hypothetical protein